MDWEAELTALVGAGFPGLPQRESGSPDADRIGAAIAPLWLAGLAALMGQGVTLTPIEHARLAGAAGDIILQASTGSEFLQLVQRELGTERFLILLRVMERQFRLQQELAASVAQHLPAGASPAAPPPPPPPAAAPAPVPAAPSSDTARWAAALRELVHLPRGEDGLPDASQVGKLAVGLWLGGEVEMRAHGIEVPPQLIAGLAASAQEVSLGNADGALFMTALRSELGDAGFLSFLRALDSWRSLDVTLAGAEGVGGDLHLRRVAGFEILELLGEGGMGRVYKALQRSLDRMVAIKVLSPSLQEDEEYGERLEYEAKAAARLKHPNIVGVIEQGTCPHSGVKFVAFEYVDGSTGQDLLREHGKLPEPDALTLCLAMAEALACAEASGIVHRDVKPENILIGSDGIPKLADLGLARRMGEGSSGITGAMFMGTPNYVAPEQALGVDEVDIRGDLYSLGLSLFQFLCGELPFKGPTPLAVVTSHINEDVPDVRTFNPDVSEQTAQLIAWMCARERAQRYQSAQACAESLKRVLGGTAPFRPSGTGRIIGKRTRTSTGLLRRAAPAAPSALSDTPAPEEAVSAPPQPPVSSETASGSARFRLAPGRAYYDDGFFSEYAGEGEAAPGAEEEEQEQEMLLSDDMARAYQIQDKLSEDPRGILFNAVLMGMGDQQFDGFQRPVSAAMVKVARERGALDQEEWVSAACVDRRIARLLDKGVTQLGVPYLVLERLEPLPFHRFSAPGEPPWMDPATAIDVFTNLLVSLKSLHFRREAPAVLCDIRPQNIMLRMPSQTGQPLDDTTYLDRLASGAYEPVLVNLSSAQSRDALREAKGEVGRLIGNPLFLPPESSPTLSHGKLVPGGTFGNKTDVYSLTMTLYVLLTGDRPYASNGLYEFRGEEFLFNLLSFKKKGVSPIDPGLLAEFLGPHANAVGGVLTAGLEPNPSRRPTPGALLRTIQRKFKTEELRPEPDDDAYAFDDLNNGLHLRQTVLTALQPARSGYLS